MYEFDLIKDMYDAGFFTQEELYMFVPESITYDQVKEIIEGKVKEER